MSVTSTAPTDTSAHEAHASDFLTIKIADQMFGIPVLQVQDVLGELQVNKIPLAPPEVAGSLNLRGRIVTAIDVRCALGLKPQEKGSRRMSVVVEHEHELFSLIIDRVGDVLSLDSKDYERSPATLDKIWRDIAIGIYRLEKELLIILDVPKLLDRVRF